MKKGYDYNKKLHKSRNMLQRNKNMQEVHWILNELNIDHWLYEGALLGIYRDGDFIPWDWDVDFLVYSEQLYPNIENLVKLLKKSGFKTKYVKDKKRPKVGISRNDEKISINGYFLNKKKKLRVRIPYRFPCELFDPGALIKFKKELYYCPEPIEKYLEMAYGDWKTPIISGNPDEYRRGRGDNSSNVEKRYHQEVGKYHWVGLEDFQGYQKINGD